MPGLVHTACASFGWALQCCSGDHEQAEEVVQMVYLKILQGKACYHEQSTLKTWLFAVIRNTARELRRRQLLRQLGMLRYEDKREQPAPAEQPDRAAEVSETAAILRDSIRRLSRRQQEVLHLVFYQDLTLNEAAHVMRISIGAARKHYDRAKQQLRKQFAPTWATEPT
jgi:RNA polymerase sigma-70 factor (ECF subfamily)